MLGRRIFAYMRFQSHYRYVDRLSEEYSIRGTTVKEIMTGTQRRKEARYQRRKAARLAKKQRRRELYDTSAQVTDGNNIYTAFRNCYRGTAFKEPAQRFRIRLLPNIREQKRKHFSGENMSYGFKCFPLIERGKKRNIRAVCFRERVAQRTLDDFALVPLLEYNLVYDNGASIKGKGNHWTLARMEALLHKYYRANGYSNEGYVLLIDLSGYFDNIRHEPLLCLYRKEITDKDLLRVSESYIRAFGDDGKSVGIGSQISQISAVRYPSEIDHTIKDKWGCKYSQRYMDDSDIIHPSKEFLWEKLKELRELYGNLGITLNPKKTQVIALKHGFPFLKTKFYLTDTGKVIKKPVRTCVTQERRKLKRLFNLYAEGKVEFGAIQQNFSSWKAHMSHKDSYRTVKTMQNIFNKLHKEAIDKWQPTTKKSA